MKERPILFSAPMVRASLDGSKTQTRRVIKVQPEVTEKRLRELGGWVEGQTLSEQVNAAWQHGFIDVDCPYGQPGDRLWVREAWRTVIEADPLPPRLMTAAYRLWFEANSPHQPGFGKLRPSMFMPRWASRTTLEITGVRVERLQDISEADAMAEGINLEGEGVFFAGIYGTASHTAKDSYRLLWESLNGVGSWDANPWVWVIGFRRLTA